MPDPPAKRRKIRPNNVITLNNASRQVEAAVKESEKTLTKVLKQDNLVAEAEKSGTKATEKENPEEKAARKESKAEEKAARKAARKLERKEVKQAAKEMKKVEKKKNSTAKKSKPIVVETTMPVSSTPTPKSYSSASDSDETDDERRTMYTKKKELASNKTTPKESVPKKILSPKKITPESNSDSDETDNESKKPVQKKPSKKTAKPIKAINTQSDSDSDSSDEDLTIKIDGEKRNISHLVSNRISFRKKRAYDDNLTVAENLKDRLSDLFVPEVNENFFISDSDSETDSGEDYEAKEYPSWQRNLDIKHNKEKDPWPTQRKFGYSDTLKLEKRIKKISRRQGYTFHEVREIFSSSQRGPYVRFFQMIAKPFPNVSLHALARQCKNMYHEKRKTGPWTEEEINQLKELVKVYGTSPTLLAEYMDRSPKNISDYLYNHTCTNKKLNKRFSKEEDELLAREACKYRNSKKADFSKIEPLFKGTRTAKQIQARYGNIRHLIQADGSLAENRKATPYEELKYLKRLLKQVKEHKLAEESQVDYTRDRGFVDKSFYLNTRASIKGFEKMSVKDILNKLIERQNIVIASRREEKLLGSDPEPDQE